VAAARHGANALLIEKTGALGGAVVTQLVGVILSTNGIDFQGIWHEWADRLRHRGGIDTLRRTPAALYPQRQWCRNSVDPECVKRV
jgi:hypothetical protein